MEICLGQSPSIRLSRGGFVLLAALDDARQTCDKEGRERPTCYDLEPKPPTQQLWEAKPEQVIVPKRCVTHRAKDRPSHDWHSPCVARLRRPVFFDTKIDEREGMLQRVHECVEARIECRRRTSLLECLVGVLLVGRNCPT